jgi:hypothetical protein
MKALHSQNRIAELMALFVTQIKGSTAMTRTDINRVAENILIPLFTEVYGFQALRNLNMEGGNYPGIDLADDEARVAFQITSQSDSEKVKHTLQKFVDNQLYRRYERLVIYILTEKQKSYSGRGYQNITRSFFSFDKDKDILDSTDLLREISNMQVWKARKVEDLLEANFGSDAPSLFLGAEEPPQESVYLSLVPLFFPETLYVATAVLDAIDDCDPFDDSERYRKRVTFRDRVRAVLDERDLRFGTDWETHGRQIITFHDLADYDIPLARIVDPNTVERITPQAFFGRSIDHENSFKSLLRRCLQQKLYRLAIQWQHEERLFIFMETNEQPIRKEQWQGKKSNTRTVYKRVMKRDKPEEVFYCQHFGFRTQVVRFAGTWYISVSPDWFISADGYRQSRYGAERIDYIKRKEKNQQVFNHLRFVVHLLRYGRASEDPTIRNYPFLSFGDLVTFDTAPALNDKTWLPAENPETAEELVTSDDDLLLD